MDLLSDSASAAAAFSQVVRMWLKKHPKQMPGHARVEGIPSKEAKAMQKIIDEKNAIIQQLEDQIMEKVTEAAKKDEQIMKLQEELKKKDKAQPKANPALVKAGKRKAPLPVTSAAQQKERPKATARQPQADS